MIPTTDSAVFSTKGARSCCRYHESNLSVFLSLWWRIGLTWVMKCSVDRIFMVTPEQQESSCHGIKRKVSYALILNCQMIHPAVAMAID